MQVILEIIDGPLSGRTTELNPGQTITVGRTARSQLMLPYDNFLSGLHFAIECGDAGCLLRDCNSSNGTWVNGNRVQEMAVGDGDQISAGQTRFRVRLQASVFSDDKRSTVLFAAPRLDDLQATAVMPGMMQQHTGAGPLTPQQQAFVSYLKLLPAPLFVLANASIEDRVSNWLISSGEVYQYVAEGLGLGEALPPSLYLGYVPATSLLLPKLVQESWGKQWCVFFTSMHPFAEVRKHFRQLLLVRTEEGQRFYFRYYDPRILQYTLQQAGLQELTQLFGPVHLFLVQDAADPGRLLEFSMTPQGLGIRPLPLGAG